MIPHKGLELRACNHHNHHLLHHLRHLHLWLSKLETHLQTQRGRLLAMCWAKQQEARPCKVLRELLQLQVLALWLELRVDRLE